MQWSRFGLLDDWLAAWLDSTDGWNGMEMTLVQMFRIVLLIIWKELIDMNVKSVHSRKLIGNVGASNDFQTWNRS